MDNKTKEMKHLFERYVFDIAKEFEEIAKSSVEYFNEMPDVDVDVRMFDETGFTVKEFEKYIGLFKQILKKNHLKLESYDEDSFAMMKNPLWKESETLNNANNQTGIFE